MATLKSITRAVSGNGAINQDEGQRGLLMHRQGLEAHIHVLSQHSLMQPASQDSQTPVQHVRSRQLIKRET